MLGKKRRNDSISDANPFHYRRVGPEFYFGGPVPVAVPSLERRKAARKHVRALNTEFASWVQSQLQDHPDELWEDGVSDYLTHASDISEKFTDVVSWLKTNAVNEGHPSTIGSQNIEKQNGPETVGKENINPVNSIFDKLNDVGLASSSSSEVSTTPSQVQDAAAGSSPSWNFGLSTSSQTLSRSSSAGLATSWNPGAFSDSKSSWNFGLSTSSQTLSRSSSAGLATSWNPGAFSDSKSVASSQEAGAFSSLGSGNSSSNQTALPMPTFSFMSSTSSGLFTTSLTPSFSTTPSFTTPWTDGAISNSQLSFTFGDDEQEQPSSLSLKNSEEKGVVVVHETKCKLFVKPTDPADIEPWKDKGIGQLFIKCEEGASKGTKESKPRILVRSESSDVGRIMLNASLYAGIKTNLQENAIVAIFHTLEKSAGDDGSDKPVARTFLIKTKNEEERDKLAGVIHEHAPAT